MNWFAANHRIMVGMKAVKPDRVHSLAGLAAAIIFCLLVLGGALLTPGVTQASTGGTAWGRLPVLEQYLLSSGSAEEIQAALGLSGAEIERLQALAFEESDRLRQLERESQAILADPGLSIAQKRALIETSGYNQRLAGILAESQAVMAETLEEDDYRALVDWIENSWQAERAAWEAGLSGEPSTVSAAAAAQASPPRTFEVYATRYDAGGAYYIALPDKCLKFANGSAMRCSDGYEYGQNYSVAITYEGRTVYATVGESGPWNIDDNYWSTLSDPQPRRMFADLPMGVPAAQAAYFNGYNGGLDQFGRLVTSPVAIDISYAVAEDLKLPAGNNKVTVTFLWTEGWGSSSGSGEADQPAGSSNPQPAAPLVVEYATATPNPDGAIVHIVQEGQTLTGIAKVYGIEIGELLELNDLTMDSVILIGDSILVRPADPTPTFSPTRIPPSPTVPETATPIETASATPAAIEQTPSPPAGESDSSPGILEDVDTPTLIIAGIAVVGVILILYGLVSRQG